VSKGSAKRVTRIGQRGHREPSAGQRIAVALVKGLAAFLHAVGDGARDAPARRPERRYPPAGSTPTPARGSQEDGVALGCGIRVGGEGAAFMRHGRYDDARPGRAEGCDLRVEWIH